MVSERRGRYLWRYSDLHKEAALVRHLSKTLGLDGVIVHLLVQRGYRSAEAIEQFIAPTWSHLHNPFLMKDMDKAVSRVIKAFHNKEPILIYGDYDVDGTTGAALWSYFLKHRQHPFEYYVPDREKEGYGLSKQGIAYAKAKNFSLIIAIDCGIKGHEVIEMANAYQIDVIVCDHHEPGETLPPAYAVLNPKRSDCTYPFNGLSGAAVAFKLLQGVEQQLPSHFPWQHYADLLALSVVCDLVPMRDENRVLASLGLKKLKEDPIPPLEELMHIASVKAHRRDSVYTALFQLGPRLNAMGRLYHAKHTIAFLLNELSAAPLHLANEERKSIQEAILKEIIEHIEKHPEEFRDAIVLWNPHWEAGVIGIVAAKLVERYHLPTLLLTKDSKGYLKGSGRAPEGFHLYQALKHCKDFLVNFGGHQAAAGLQLKEKDFDAFKNQFIEYCKQHFPPHMRVPRLFIDCNLPFDRINYSLFKQLKYLEPYGPEHLPPTFATHNVLLTHVEDRGHYLRLYFKKDYITFESYLWNYEPYSSVLQVNRYYHIAYHVEELYNTPGALCLTIKDLILVGK